ncbi:MAG: type IX secretion system membrane protein PorP/SprF [Bacteroidota bacterium]|jgi:hypothetical protein
MGNIYALTEFVNSATNSPFYLKPGALYYRQKGITGKNFESFRIGAAVMTRRILIATYYKNESVYDLKTNESLIYVLGTTFINARPIINFYYAYDMTISKLATNTRGTHEIGISCLFEGSRLFKRTTGPGRKLIKSCPEFGFMPQWM